MVYGIEHQAAYGNSDHDVFILEYETTTVVHYMDNDTMALNYPKGDFVKVKADFAKTNWKKKNKRRRMLKKL